MISKIIIAIVILVVTVFSLCTYRVDETERAILFKFGEIKKADIKPGLHWKIPFINNERKFDSRILTLDVQPDLFPTSEKKYVFVDFFVKWRIDNVRDYFVATGGLEERANSRLSQITKDRLRDEFASRTITEAVSGERADIMSDILHDPNKRLIQFEDGEASLTYLTLENASLASLSVGPILDNLEMSCEGRTFADVARKILYTRPLYKQRIAKTDSTFGIHDKRQALVDNYLHISDLCATGDCHYHLARIIRNIFQTTPTR